MRIGMVDLLPSGALRIQSQNVFYHNRESDERTVSRADAIGSRQCQTLARQYSITDARRYPPAHLFPDGQLVLEPLTPGKDWKFGPPTTGSASYSVNSGYPMLLF